MRSPRRLESSITPWAVAVGFAATVLLVPYSVAQTCSNTTPYNCPGSPVVYNSAGTQQNSSAYIDVSTLVGNTATDFCAVLNKALVQLAANYTGFAGVIDARGINPANSLIGTCSNTSSGNPWHGISTPSIVLLPAGIIKTQAPWILPAGTRLIGEGGEDPGSSDSTTGRTIIQSQSTMSPMIQMGTSNGCALASGANGETSVEDLVLDANSQQIDGIDNLNCQELSYVSHVTIYRATGIGLSVSTTAPNSGPYSHITFDTKNVTPNGSTECANIAAGTRGIDHMTCTTGATSDTVANGIVVAAQGNSVEDVRIEGFATGVSVKASNNVLINILGDSNPLGASAPVDVVDIESGLSNVALIGITNNCTTNCQYAYTVSDNATGAQLLHSTDGSVAMYVLGNCTTPSNCTATSAYSRYTTSPSVANWSVGTTNAPTTGGCSAPGSLYSNASSNASPALYVCSAASGTFKKWETVK